MNGKPGLLNLGDDSQAKVKIPSNSTKGQTDSLHSPPILFSCTHQPAQRLRLMLDMDSFKNEMHRGVPKMGSPTPKMPREHPVRFSPSEQSCHAHFCEIELGTSQRPCSSTALKKGGLDWRFGGLWVISDTRTQGQIPIHQSKPFRVY